MITKIRKACLLFVVMFSFLLSTAQDVNPFMSTEFTQITRLEFDLRVKEPDSKDRLFCNQWCEGQVITRLDTLSLKFNYDLYDEFFYINMNQKVFTIKSDFIVGFNMDDRSFMCYSGYQEDEVLILESLVQGKYTLYEHHGIKFKASDFDPLLNIGSKEASYKRTNGYYAFCDNRLLKISSKPKKTLKHLVKECEASRLPKFKGSIIELFETLNY